MSQQDRHLADRDPVHWAEMRARIAELMRAAGELMPSTDEELEAALEKLGDVAPLDDAFIEAMTARALGKPAPYSAVYERDGAPDDELLLTGAGVAGAFRNEPKEPDPKLDEELRQIRRELLRKRSRPDEEDTDGVE